MHQISSACKLTTFLPSTNSHNKYLATGGITVYHGEVFELVMVGEGLDNIRAVKFTTVNNTYGDSCHGGGSSHTSDTFSEFRELESPGLRAVAVPGLQYWSDQRVYYLCVATDLPDQAGEYQFLHQGGEEKSIQIYMDRALLPIWVMICLIVVLLFGVSVIPCNLDLS